MEDTLIKITDEKETLLRPIDATFKVEYKYEGEATAEVVLEGDVKRGTVIKDESPAPDASKDLEYSEIVIDVKDKPNNLAYASKTSRFAGRVPPKGTPVPLPFLGNIPKNKEEKQLAMAEKRKSILERLKEIYPPK